MDIAARQPPALVLAQPRLLPWGLSLLAGIAGALALFPVPVLLGTAPFWNNPRGVVGGSWGDMAQALSGYLAYVQDVWRWPLFQADGLGPHGVNVVFTDSVPVVALVGRLLFRATGLVVPLYGAWSGLCVVGMALAMTGLVRALGARSPVAALAAAVIGVSSPALLMRWGHLSLMAQFLVPLALLAYVRMSQAPRPRAGRVLGTGAALCLGSLLVHPYLLLMVGGITAAAILQAATDRRLAWPAATGMATVLAALVAGAAGAMGYGASGGLASAAGFGLYSANLLSPVLPYWLPVPGGLLTVDGTGGQYEGAAFLGSGVLLLVLLARRSVVATAVRGVRRHPWLLATMAGFTALAVSNEVYVGSLHLASLPLPAAAQWAAGVVRASGRLIWVDVYLLTALAIAVTGRQGGTMVLLVAAALQAGAAEPLREQVRARVAAAPASLLDQPAWHAALRGADRLILDPPLACMPDGPRQAQLRRAAVEFQLLAAQEGVPTNTLYAARTAPDCTVPAATARSILVRFSPAQPPLGLPCQIGPVLTVCGMLPTGTPDRLVTLAPEEDAE